MSVFFKPVYFLGRQVFRLLALMIPYGYTKAVHPTLSLQTIRDYNKNRTLGPRKIICNAPFAHMYFKQSGKVTACCASSADAYGNIRETSVAEIWKGEKANRLRDSIRNYNLSGGCTGCQHSLESGNYNAFIGRIYDSLLPAPVREYPTEMTFETSNTCNLECIMCTGEFSNLIRKNVERLSALPNYYGQEFFEEIKPFLSHLKRVRMMGGEPFLIKEYAPILEYLVKHNPGCKIYIQTNGTVLNNSVKKIIESRNVELSISIDSLQKERYESIRKNGNFERVMEHLLYFSERATRYGQLININFCVMNNNWQEVPGIMEFCDKNNFTINLIPVANPRHLSLRICSVDYLNKVFRFSKDTVLNVTNSRLLAVYNDYLNYLVSMSETSRIKSIRKNQLSGLTVSELYTMVKALFESVNRIPSGSKEQEIFDAVFLNPDGVDEVAKKSIYSAFITDLEGIDNSEISETNSYGELMSRSRQMLGSLKAELKYRL